MQNNQMINLAIMGIGTIGKRHLMAIDTINNVNLCGPPNQPGSNGKLSKSNRSASTVPCV